MRARDDAGNADITPATRAFSVVTPIIESLETATEAAELYFPDEIRLDVPASCGTTPAIDCPNGTPLPPSEQLSVTSIRNVAAVPDHKYDITVRSPVASLATFKMDYSGASCDVSLSSEDGNAPSWGVGAQLQFYMDNTFGDRRIAVSTPSVSGVEEADYNVSGGFICQSGFISPSVIQSVYADTLDEYIEQVGDPLCADPGPAYLGGPCQQHQQP